tara:strand:- start:609 stop:896 length:288 start_codon:yes stop_codon:yes gene_type:complete
MKNLKKKKKKSPILKSETIKIPEPYIEKTFHFPKVDGYSDGLEFIIHIYKDGSYTLHYWDDLEIDTSSGNDEYYDEIKPYTDRIIKICGLDPDRL